LNPCGTGALRVLGGTYSSYTLLFGEELLSFLFVRTACLGSSLRSGDGFVQPVELPVLFVSDVSETWPVSGRDTLRARRLRRLLGGYELVRLFCRVPLHVPCFGFVFPGMLWVRSSRTSLGVPKRPCVVCVSVRFEIPWEFPNVRAFLVRPFVRAFRCLCIRAFSFLGALRVRPCVLFFRRVACASVRAVFRVFPFFCLCVFGGWVGL